MEGNAFTFNNKNWEPIMEFRTNWDIYVRGKLTTNDMEVVDGVRKFLSTHKVGTID